MPRKPAPKPAKAPAKKAPDKKPVAPAKKPAAKPAPRPPAKKPAPKADPKPPKPKPKKKAARQKAEKPLEPLTYRQRMFVGYYAGEAKGNGTEAARLAGYGSPRVEASRLLTNANIQAAIAARTAAVAMPQDEVLARISDIASADLGPALKFTRHGEPSLDLRVLRKLGLTHLIKEIRHTLHGTTIKFHDPLRAVELLGRYHGLFDREAERDETPAAARPRLVIPDRDERS